MEMVPPRPEPGGSGAGKGKLPSRRSPLTDPEPPPPAASGPPAGSSSDDATQRGSSSIPCCSEAEARALWLKTAMFTSDFAYRLGRRMAIAGDTPSAPPACILYITGYCCGGCAAAVMCWG